MLHGRGLAYARYVHSKFPGFGAAWAAWAVELTCDPETGRIVVRRVVVGQDTGLMLNPFAALPPFVTANPPFWVIPGLLMGDFFTDPTGATGVEFSANVPLLAGFDVVFKRPLPTITLQMLLEIAALAAHEFSVELPANSALKTLFYAELTGTITLHALSGLFRARQGTLTVSNRFNIVDLINAGEVDMIINTPYGNPGPRVDGYEIRTAAVFRDIPCITTVQGAAAAVQGIEALIRGDITVRPLQALHAALRATPTTPHSVGFPGRLAGLPGVQ